MSRLIAVSTINIIPQTVSALNVVPINSSTVTYASVIDGDDNNRYGGFKFGTTNQYGPTSEISAGQKMPEISTGEI